MFQRLMASVGIGAAKVDAVLTTDRVPQGGKVEGRIEITGGQVAQEIDAIKLRLMTMAKKEVGDAKAYMPHTIADYEVVEPFTIGAGEERSLPFSFTLHPETPVTALPFANNQCRVWLETSLDIDNAIDPKDRDTILVTPLPVVQRVLDIMQEMGARPLKADVESGQLRGRQMRSTAGFYQEIEFSSGGFLSRQEIELSFILDGDVMRCLVELDRGFGGDTYREFALSLSAGDAEIRQVLNSLV